MLSIDPEINFPQINPSSQISEKIDPITLELEGNVDDIANPSKGEGFMKLRGQEVYLEFEISKKKKVIFDYMGKKLTGLERALKYIERDIWMEESYLETDSDLDSQNWESQVSVGGKVFDLDWNDGIKDRELRSMSNFNQGLSGDRDSQGLSRSCGRNTKSRRDKERDPTIQKPKQTKFAKLDPRPRPKKKTKIPRKVRIKYFEDVCFEGLLEDDYVKCHKRHIREAFNLDLLLKKHRELFNIPHHFSGSIVNGLKSGHCKEIFDDGSVFQGFYNQGKREGWGLLADGGHRSVYKGQFKEGKMSGSGVKMEKGDKLVGEFFEGMLGEGVIEYRNGVKYVGPIQNGLRHGRGKLVFNNDYVFEGMFQHDAITTATEKGVLVDSKQNRYACDFDEAPNSKLKFLSFNNAKILFLDPKSGELLSFL